MSDEFDSIPETRFSSFVPLAIFLTGFLCWLAYQDYTLNTQRGIYDQQITSAMPGYQQALTYWDRYKKVINDLANVASTQKDPAAIQITKEAIQAGWISIQPGTNSAGTPAQPAPPAAPAK